jgi:hypothetical protein
VGPQSLTLRTMARRLDAHGDIWAALFDRPHGLPEPL